MQLRLGIDVACRAAHQASLADERGEFVWSGRSFRTRARDLEALWALLPAGTDPLDVTIVMEPTRNAWVALAAWFRRQGATVVLVPPERAADLRAYDAKHTKGDRLDSRLLVPSAPPPPGRSPSGARARTRRRPAPGDEAPLDVGLASGQVTGPARRPPRNPRARLARGLPGRPRQQDATPLSGRRLRRSRHAPAARTSAAGSLLRPPLPRDVGRGQG